MYACDHHRLDCLVHNHFAGQIVQLVVSFKLLLHIHDAVGQGLGDSGNDRINEMAIRDISGGALKVFSNFDEVVEMLVQL